MLQLKSIVKDYLSGDNTVKALKGVTLAFRDCEFVSILGPSGCGKTTMLNIIGGLDRYTSGDLIINGRSTKEFKDADGNTLGKKVEIPVSAAFYYGAAYGKDKFDWLTAEGTITLSDVGSVKPETPLT